MQTPKSPPGRTKQWRSLILGGILPIVAYTIIEEVFGTLWGLVAGMALGIFEILWEWRTHGRVDLITWIGNAILLLLGGVSLLTKSGIWFKLQPAILELLMAGFLIFSVILRKPFLSLLAKKQNMFVNLPVALHSLMLQSLGSLTLRVGLFFLVHALIATWAALYWSTRAWAILKGVGFTASFVVYMIAETLLLRKQIKRQLRACETITFPI